MSRTLEEVLVDALRLLRARGDGHLPTLIHRELLEAVEADTPEALPCPVCDDGIQEKCLHCGREP